MFGDFVLSVPNGPGVYNGDMVSINGEMGWVHDIKQGNGECKWYDGSNYKGFWFNNQKNGKGVLRLGDGSSYEGEWKDDKMHGSGKLVTSNGTTVVGTWYNGRLHGRGTITRKHEPSIEVRFSHGTLIYEKGKSLIKDAPSNLGWLNMILVGGAIGCGVASFVVKDEKTARSLRRGAFALWGVNILESLCSSSFGYLGNAKSPEDAQYALLRMQKSPPEIL